MEPRFRPGLVRYDGAMSRNYDAARSLSADSARAWRDALGPYLRNAPAVLDVGSGTGRFAIALAEWFGARVVGVEPARGMLDVAGHHRAVRYVAGRAERLPVRAGAFDAALLSNVYHHVVDRRACSAELHRVLRRGGRVLIRGAFGDRLDGLTLFDHFPEAKAVCEQFPTLEEAVETFADRFRVEAVTPVVTQTCASLKELAARTRTRADTTLALMPDDAFRRRQEALERAAAGETTPTGVQETLDLVVLRSR
jgi:ubiquinone/menaquinone biosynthesis C-methylase UbiE